MNNNVRGVSEEILHGSVYGAVQLVREDTRLALSYF